MRLRSPHTAPALALAAALALTAPAPAQSDTSFTYQAALHDAGIPADGLYNIDATLWDAPSGGSQQGPEIQFNAHPVADGLVTLELDFGDRMTIPISLWLQLSVNGTELSPRQPITNTPFATRTRGINVDPDSDVGIATTQPQAMLHIDGAATSHGVLRLDSPGASAGSIEFNSPRGQMGLAATAPNGKRRDIWFMDEGLGLFTSDSGDSPFAGDGLFIDTRGRVGIGTTQPGWDFNVVGNSLFNGAIAVRDAGINVQDGTISVSAEQLWPVYSRTDAVGSGSYAANAVYGYASRLTGWANGVWGETESNEGNGVLGWAAALNGTTFGVRGIVDSPSGRGVAGHARANSGVGYGVFGEANSPNGAGVYAVSSATSGNAIALLAQTNSPAGYAAYVIGPSGSRSYFQRNVGIGHTSPGYLLHLGANSAAKPTSDRWTVSSDRRLKKNITTIDGALDDLLRLRGVTYQWKDPASQGGMAGTYHGMIAQDVEKVFPQWVGEDEQGFKTLTITGFEGVAVEALRQLRAEKDTEIAQLHQRVERLEALVLHLTNQRTEQPR